MEHSSKKLSLVRDAAIYSNTQAIGLMLEGKQDEALELFHRTINLAGHMSEVDSDSSGSFCLQAAPDIGTDETCIYDVSLDEVIYPVDCSERTSLDNCFKVRRCLFAVDSMQGVNHGAALSKTLAIVMYNIGVIYHECGLACMNEDMLSRSLWLYNLAIAILGKLDKTSSEPACDVQMIPFEMALYNNLGHI